ncbi:phenol hydroxylase [Hydrogenophaga crassostreae]|uniref:Phenol hydroxylase n=1 Tax=Hydrogenophaga crassostreae TaxID=1763535 RepID=A0A163CLT0_9BURK|nr:phenol hydroxylase subunit [Hydrogenophaga crassostreae]AOW14464.1 phenol hydroxylase [Hydrogenophaga crassostreae]OAD43512.1 phenol hydroxylase [Hydrogenophaga crassostreae]
MPTVQAPTTNTGPSLDLKKRYVRLLERRPDGLVSFEFSIGWPELAVELMLPDAAFEEFCDKHQVIWREH